MSEWQRCPICTGRGVLNFPPGTPIGQDFSTTSCGPWPCDRCNGTGTITTPIAQDRVHTPVKFTATDCGCPVGHEYGNCESSGCMRRTNAWYLDQVNN